MIEEAVIADASCALEDSYIAEQLYLPAEFRLQRGDVLLCKKSDTTPCENADFQWLDTSAQALVAARPENALQMPFMRAYTSEGSGDQLGDLWCNTDCDPGAPYCGYQLGDYTLNFAFPENRGFRLYSEFIFDTDPRHPESIADLIAEVVENDDLEVLPCEDEAAGLDCLDSSPPVTWYHYEPLDGPPQEGLGLKMQVTVRFDLEDFLFVEGVSSEEELADLSDVEFLQSLHIRDMLARGEPHNYGHTPLQRGWVELAFRE